MKTDLCYDNFLIFDLSDLLNLVTVGAKYYIIPNTKIMKRVHILMRIPPDAKGCRDLRNHLPSPNTLTCSPTQGLTRERVFLDCEIMEFVKLLLAVHHVQMVDLNGMNDTHSKQNTLVIWNRFLGLRRTLNELIELSSFVSYSLSMCDHVLFATEIRQINYIFVVGLRATTKRTIIR